MKGNVMKLESWTTIACFAGVTFSLSSVHIHVDRVNMLYLALCISYMFYTCNIQRSVFRLLVC